MFKWFTSPFNLAITGFVLLIAFWLGRFTATFDSNQCYTGIISKIDQKVNIANEEQNWTYIQQLKEQLEALPMYGYETNCSDVENAVRHWSE